MVSEQQWNPAQEGGEVASRGHRVGQGAECPVGALMPGDCRREHAATSEGLTKSDLEKGLSSLEKHEPPGSSRPNSPGRKDGTQEMVKNTSLIHHLQ